MSFESGHLFERQRKCGIRRNEIRKMRDEMRRTIFIVKLQGACCITVACVRLCNISRVQKEKERRKRVKDRCGLYSLEIWFSWGMENQLFVRRDVEREQERRHALPERRDNVGER